jgi:hypothetical protein
MSQTVTIGRRFNGPPGSAHGGYACGMFAHAAAHAASPADLMSDAEVTLRRPPPLEVAIAAVPSIDGVVFEHDGVVADVRAARVDLDAVEVPLAPSVDQARDAGARSPMHSVDPDELPFATCFGCGPSRAAGDGLRLWPGRLDHDRAACVWEPDTSLADGSAVVGPEMVWAALDCPGLLGAKEVLGRPLVEVTPSVLGRMSATVRGRAEIGVPHVVLSWPIVRDGRKLTVGTAVLGDGGRVIGLAHAVWIDLGPS